MYSSKQPCFHSTTIGRHARNPSYLIQLAFDANRRRTEAKRKKKRKKSTNKRNENRENNEREQTYESLRKFPSTTTVPSAYWCNKSPCIKANQLRLGVLPKEVFLHISRQLMLIIYYSTRCAPCFGFVTCRCSLSCSLPFNYILHIHKCTSIDIEICVCERHNFCCAFFHHPPKRR
jgi:hypothetical protein